MMLRGRLRAVPAAGRGGVFLCSELLHTGCTVWRVWTRTVEHPGDGAPGAESRSMVAQFIRSIEAEQMKPDTPEFGPGDTVRVHAKVVEGNRERVQVFEGVVIRRRSGGINENFTVR